MAARQFRGGIPSNTAHCTHLALLARRVVACAADATLRVGGRHVDDS